MNKLTSLLAVGLVAVVLTATAAVAQDEAAGGRRRPPPEGRRPGELLKQMDADGDDQVT